MSDYSDDGVKGFLFIVIVLIFIVVGFVDNLTSVSVDVNGIVIEKHYRHITGFRGISSRDCWEIAVRSDDDILLAEVDKLLFYEIEDGDNVTIRCTTSAVKDVPSCEVVQ